MRRSMRENTGDRPRSPRPYGKKLIPFSSATVDCGVPLSSR
jgi:hypothetical protein